MCAPATSELGPTPAPLSPSPPAQVGVNAYQALRFINECAARPRSALEAAASCAAKAAVDLDAGLVLLVGGDAALIQYVTKYRPKVGGRGVAFRRVCVGGGCLHG